MLMKRCPQCGRVYEDETVRFCLEDGSRLSDGHDSAATLVSLQPPVLPPAQAWQYPVQATQAAPQRHSPVLVYTLIALVAFLALLLGGGIVFLLKSGSKVDLDAAKTSSPNPAPSNSLQNNRTPVPSPNRDNNRVSSATGNAETPPSVPTELLGRWHGEWSSPTGTIFSADVTLEETGNGNGVQGTINWMMRSTPQPAKQARIGLAAIEYVRGDYDPATRMLAMAGYKKDDPNKVIVLDKYRLNLGAGGATLGGATWNQGKWTGRLSLTR
jgi:hypothetical protein